MIRLLPAPGLTERPAAAFQPQPAGVEWIQRPVIGSELALHSRALSNVCLQAFDGVIQTLLLCHPARLRRSPDGSGATVPEVLAEYDLSCL